MQHTEDPTAASIPAPQQHNSQPGDAAADDLFASPRSAATGGGGGTNAADEDDGDDYDEFGGLDHIPLQLKASTESDTVRFMLRPQEDMEEACSPEHGRGDLFSPTFHGGEVAYSKHAPPVPAALLRAVADGGVDAVVPPGAATNGGVAANAAVGCGMDGPGLIG